MCVRFCDQVETAGAPGRTAPNMPLRIGRRPVSSAARLGEQTDA
jgi:hypothetical protein